MREPTFSSADTTRVGNLHPELIRVARDCYYTYLRDLERTGQSQTELPIGIAVDRVSHRAKPIVDRKQPLLPQEHFVPRHLIDPNDLRSALDR